VVPIADEVGTGIVEYGAHIIRKLEAIHRIVDVVAQWGDEPDDRPRYWQFTRPGRIAGPECGQVNHTGLGALLPLQLVAAQRVARDVPQRTRFYGDGAALNL